MAWPKRRRGGQGEGPAPRAGTVCDGLDPAGHSLPLTFQVRRARPWLLRSELWACTRARPCDAHLCLPWRPAPEVTGPPVCRPRSGRSLVAARALGCECFPARVQPKLLAPTGLSEEARSWDTLPTPAWQQSLCQPPGQPGQHCGGGHTGPGLSLKPHLRLGPGGAAVGRSSRARPQPSTLRE